VGCDGAMNQQKVTKVTESEEKEIRDEYDKFMLVSRASCDDCSLHLPGEDKPLCGRTVAKRTHHYENQDDWKRKETAVYPPGHKDICRYCAAKWRGE